MKKSVAWIIGCLVALVLSSQAYAAVNEEEPMPPPDENGICIPTTPIGFSKACDGPNPPEYCNNYDPDYGDWFVPGEGGIFEVLFGGIRHVYSD